MSTLIATKAARVVTVARGRPVAEFAFRRAHQPFIVARSAYIGGCASTSFVAGARVFGLPASGTIRHALVQAFDKEVDAFRAVAESFPNYTLLLDTYDPRWAAHIAATVAREASDRWGHKLVGVRLDSGDLVEDSRYVRRVLDDAGLQETRIFVSGDLDEFAVEALVRRNAPIDAFGVGTSIGAGAGHPRRGIAGGSLGAVYKLVWYEDGEPARIKLASDKSTWPGRKQVYRIGQYNEDRVQLDDEPSAPTSVPLLRPLLRERHAQEATEPSLKEIRERASEALRGLPAIYHDLTAPSSYPVCYSGRLARLREKMMAAVGDAASRHAGSHRDFAAP